MRGNRSLVIIALVLIVLAVVAGGAYIYLQMLRPDGEPELEAVTTPVPEPVDMTEIVVAIQNIPRGMQISVEDNAIALQEWPSENLPYEYYTAIEEVDGKFARMEIPRGWPVTPDVIGRPGGMLSVSGSAAALFEPEDRVAYAVPFDVQGAVGWAVKPGDRVDVLAALKIKPVYTDFLEEGVKQFTYLLSGEEGEVAQTSPFGQFELLPNGRWAAIYPLDTQTSAEPALLVQMTVQDAVVWHVGEWTEEEAEITPATSTGAGEREGLTEGPAPAPAAEPTPVVLEEGNQEVELVTLLVTREDALILKYLHEMGADLDLALRPANFTGTVLQTQPIWFRYILDKYHLPDSMPDDPVGPVPIHEPLEPLSEPTPVPEE
ncbi:MAG: Flp pilus assembly protein CpaB [Anaerolineae bacterium]